jgi:hypothetical protein
MPAAVVSPRSRWRGWARRRSGRDRGGGESTSPPPEARSCDRDPSNARFLQVSDASEYLEPFSVRRGTETGVGPASAAKSIARIRKPLAARARACGALRGCLQAHGKCWRSKPSVISDPGTDPGEVRMNSPLNLRYDLPAGGRGCHHRGCSGDVAQIGRPHLVLRWVPGMNLGVHPVAPVLDGDHEGVCSHRTDAGSPEQTPRNHASNETTEKAHLD